jgi:TonB-dependent SusC/RagA subfamily outer membrane receptor
MVKKLTMFLAALLLTAVGAMAQTQVKGTVVSQEDGLPIVGAAVQIVGTSQGTVTNGNGEFQLTVPSSGATLRISYLGMQTINVTAARTMRIEMLSDNKILNEVVVTALGISREQKTLGYSAQTIDNAQLTEGKVTDVTSALAGKVAGVQINATSGDPGQANSVIIRGISSINGNNQPLYVIDGVPLQSTTRLAQQHQNAVGGITNVNPNDIENMTVLKGAAATALYGSRAANGVIIITTKSGQKNGARNFSISYDGSVQFRQIANLPKFQNKYGQGWNGTQTFIENGSWGPEMDGSTQVYGPIWNNQ